MHSYDAWLNQVEVKCCSIVFSYLNLIRASQVIHKTMKHKTWSQKLSKHKQHTRKTLYVPVQNTWNNTPSQHRDGNKSAERSVINVNWWSLPESPAYVPLCWTWSHHFQPVQPAAARHGTRLSWARPRWWTWSSCPRWSPLSPAGSRSWSRSMRDWSQGRGHTPTCPGRCRGGRTLRDRSTPRWWAASGASELHWNCMHR